MKNLPFILLLLGMLSLAGCKYEDGPAFSLCSKRERLARMWVFDRYWENGQEQVFEKNSIFRQFTKDGNMITYYPDTVIDGELIGGSNSTWLWSFIDNKKAIRIEFISPPPDIRSESGILRLTKKELWLGDDSYDGQDYYESHYKAFPQ